MQHGMTRATLTNHRITFTIQIGLKGQECFISQYVLLEVARTKNIDASDANPMKIFHGFEATIIGIAYRLASKKANTKPLLINPYAVHYSFLTLNFIASTLKCFLSSVL